MTGQYSVRSALSLVIIPGTPLQRPANAFTMAQMFKQQGYATAISGKGTSARTVAESANEPRLLTSLYGIPPDTSWDAASSFLNQGFCCTWSIYLCRFRWRQKATANHRGEVCQELRDVEPLPRKFGGASTANLLTSRSTSSSAKSR